MAPVTWNPKNEYTMNAGGSAFFLSHRVALGSGGMPETFRIRNSGNPTQRVDMLKPVRIYKNGVVWSKNASNEITAEENDSGGFYWQMEPLFPIKPSDNQFTARIRHIGGGYVAFLDYGSTYLGHIVNKAKAAEVTVKIYERPYKPRPSNDGGRGSLGPNPNFRFS